MPGLRALLPAAAAAAALMASASSCQEEERTYVADLSDPEHHPTMRTEQVVTVISDSGYTRYRITSPLWLMYDEAAEPRWTFPQGLKLRQYDQALRTSSTMTCDSATYYTARRLWRLDGNVVMVNALRDSFLTQQLFWDQNRAQVRSDSFIHIVRQDRVIEGHGFQSNEQMTRFSVLQTQAIIPVDRDRRPGAPGPGASPARIDLDADTAAPPAQAAPMTLDMRRRLGAPVRASRRTPPPLPGLTPNP